MEREQLEQAFCKKISSELGLFKEQMLKMEKEEVFALAYWIDCTIRIYEILMELSKSLGDRELWQCTRTERLLESLYNYWLKVPDTQNEELENSLQSAINAICVDVA